MYANWLFLCVIIFSTKINSSCSHGQKEEDKYRILQQQFANKPNSVQCDGIIYFKIKRTGGNTFS